MVLVSDAKLPSFRGGSFRLFNILRCPMRWLSLFAAVGMLFFQMPRRDLPENIYPEWFFAPPLSGGPFSVGYSDEHARGDSAVNAATREAAVNYVKSQRVQIIGEQGMATFAAGKIPVGSTIKEQYDEEAARNLGSTMKAVDWFLRKGAATVIASTDSTPVTGRNRRIDAAKVKEPVWVTSVPDSQGYIFSTGLAPVYYHENNSWREAERKARTNLALSLYSQIKFLGKKMDDVYYREFQVEETNVTLVGARVIARWKDVKNRICYVLVRMPLAR